MSRGCWGLLVLLALSWSAPDRAMARPIPIVWGQGEKFTEVGPLPAEINREFVRDRGRGATLAFVHRRLHIFWLDLWTWDGRYAIHLGENYYELSLLSGADLKTLEARQLFRQPLLYRFPPLAILGGLALVASGLHRWWCSNATDRFHALLNDRRYHDAVWGLVATSRGDTQQLGVAPVGEREWTQAVQRVVDGGIERTTAEANLRFLMQIMWQQASQQIDDQLAVAQEQFRNRQYAASADSLREVLARMPETDPRRPAAEAMLAQAERPGPRRGGVPAGTPSA